MFSKFRYRIEKRYQMFAVGCGVAGAIALMSVLGIFESLELGILDQFLRVRASRDVVDERILVVVIREEDIAAAGQWPMSDATLAKLIEQIQVHKPSGIGIDLYRNLPVEPGVDDLVKAFESMPNVVGIERVIDEPVLPHPTLLKKGQSGSSDLVLDKDGTVRRGLLSVISPTGEVKQTLGATLALNYLHPLGIEPMPLDESGLSLRLGKGKIERFNRHDGGYINADSGGFQVLMNYPSGPDRFESISMSAVLAGKLTEAQVRDRIVLIGMTAVSANDWFSEPIGGDQVAGVYIHAHLISQLLATALEGRPLLRTLPGYAEWLWTGVWVAITISASRSVLYSNALRSAVPPWQLVARLLGVSTGLWASAYGLLVMSWWLPVALPMTAMVAATLLGLMYRSHQLQNLAAFDELTQVANRRYFDQYLATALKSHSELSLILCDVDYFKVYNDRYGHPAGDRCLQQVAMALKLAVRDSDLVARYGGEEFVVVLPNTTAVVAVAIAERMQSQLRQFKIMHEGSQVSEWVTLSCGVANVSPGFSLLPAQLIEYSDQALYQAKQSGRNQVKASQWQQQSSVEKVSEEKVFEEKVSEEKVSEDEARPHEAV
jgi:adenylate cyclase